MWRPNSLAEGISNGFVPTMQIRQRSKVEYQCYCGQYRVPELLIDVRALPISQEWACDGCWTDWERHGKSIDNNPVPLNRREWNIRWVTALGAPQGVIEKIQNRQSIGSYKQDN